MHSIRSDFHAILGALSNGRVRFVIIGGVALRLHGSAHVTEDVDVIYARDRENLANLVEALKPHNPRLRARDGDVPFVWDVRTLQFEQNFTLVTDIGVLDLLGEAPGVTSFDALWQRAAEMTVHGIGLKVAAIEDLLSMKRAAGREKDRNHILELEALRRETESSG